MLMSRLSTTTTTTECEDRARILKQNSQYWLRFKYRTPLRAVKSKFERIRLPPQNDQELNPTLMWILAMKGNWSALLTTVPPAISKLLLQQTPFSSLLHARDFNLEMSSALSGEDEGRSSNFACSSKNRGQFIRCLHFHPSSQSPAGKLFTTFLGNIFSLSHICPKETNIICKTYDLQAAGQKLSRQFPRSKEESSRCQPPKDLSASLQRPACLSHCNRETTVLECGLCETVRQNHSLLHFTGLHKSRQPDFPAAAVGGCVMRL